ncbi:MAG: zinc ribbon domain-containing protein [Ruminococcus sp.]|nr:zinc ribbon domain-containing protein [Ruminococcus sp.]
MLCPNCGTDAHDYSFCPNCGIDLTAYSAPVAEPKKKGHILTATVAVILAILLLSGICLSVFSAFFYNKSTAEVFAEEINRDPQDGNQIIYGGADVYSDGTEEYLDESERNRKLGEKYSCDCADVSIVSAELVERDKDTRENEVRYALNFEVTNKTDGVMNYYDKLPVTIWDENGEEYLLDMPDEEKSFRFAGSSIDEDHISMDKGGTGRFTYYFNAPVTKKIVVEVELYLEGEDGGSYLVRTCYDVPLPQPTKSK